MKKTLLHFLKQLKTDIDVYNDLNKHEEPIQLVLDFTDDVAEREQIAA